jgi:hypothetical protein
MNATLPCPCRRDSLFFGNELANPTWPDAGFWKYLILLRARQNAILGTRRGFGAAEKSKRYRGNADSAGCPDMRGSSGRKINVRPT